MRPASEGSPPSRPLDSLSSLLRNLPGFWLSGSHTKGVGDNLGMKKQRSETSDFISNAKTEKKNERRSEFSCWFLSASCCCSRKGITAPRSAGVQSPAATCALLRRPHSRCHETAQNRYHRQRRGAGRSPRRQSLRAPRACRRRQQRRRASTAHSESQ